MKTSKEARAKQPNNGLLGTYFVSLFSLVLSCTMLLGTTYAWFNASRTSLGNVIEAGELKVDLFHVTGGNKVSLANNPNAGVFSGIWDPGEAMTQTFEVYNAGNLPVHCKVYFADDDTEVLSETAQNCFQVSTSAGTLSGENKLTDVIKDRKPLFATVVPLEKGERQTFTVTLKIDGTLPPEIMNNRGTVHMHLIAEQAVRP